MKIFAMIIGIVAFCWGLASLQESQDQIVILGGDTQGYLSPCGCSSPMTGGIRRRATYIRRYTIPGHTTLLENGGFVESAGRQDEMKAETLAQSLLDLGVSAINIGPSEARLGQGELFQLSQLTGDRLVSLSVSDPENHSLHGTVASGPFLIGGATDLASNMASSLGAQPVQVRDAVRKLVDAADEAGLRPVLMLQGSHDSAVRLAKEFPKLALIQYSSIGPPPPAMETVGKTALATTGEHGKRVVRMTYRNGEFADYQCVTLGPEFADDPVVSRYYAAYLRRVGAEKLLDKLPRKETAAYAGSQRCLPCHASSYRVWHLSDHAHAYQTLQKQSHQLDPDCVSCHVVGLASSHGFRSIVATPQFAGVGCENCHGPALAHVLKPNKAKLPKLTERACIGCHNPLNSPNFEFASYWRKIAHH